jgi:hypothetical protein
MKVFRNTTQIAKRDKLGRRLSTAGLIILFIGLLASFVPTMYPPGSNPEGALAQFMLRNWALISFAALPLGFLAASLGSYFITRYARRRWPGSATPGRPDEAFERSLKGLDDRFSLFIFSLPVAYTLVTPSQIISFAMRSDKGTIRVQGNKWREGWGLGRVLTLFAREGVGHPPSDLADQEKKLRAYLAQATADANGQEFGDVPIEGAVVLLNAETKLELTGEPTVPVLRADQLKEYVRKRVKDVKPTPLVKAAAEYMATHNSATETSAASTKVKGVSSV